MVVLPNQGSNLVFPEHKNVCLRPMFTHKILHACVVVLEIVSAFCWGDFQIFHLCKIHCSTQYMYLLGRHRPLRKEMHI